MKTDSERQLILDELESTHYDTDGTQAPVGIITALSLSAVIWTILGCVVYYIMHR